ACPIYPRKSWNNKVPSERVALATSFSGSGTTRLTRETSRAPTPLLRVGHGFAADVVAEVRIGPTTQVKLNRHFVEVEMLAERIEEVPLVRGVDRGGLAAKQHDGRRLDSDLRRVVDLRPTI